MNYDGSINIDTRVDTKGMNKGTKSIASGMGGVLRAIKGVGAALGLAFSGAAIINFVKKTLDSFDLMSTGAGAKIKELKDSFEGLKGALANVVLNLFVAMQPYIIAAVQWLTQMLTTLTAIISALFGVKDLMGDTAAAAEDTSKGAKGALASFDQINVLNQGKDGGKSVLPNVTIPPDILASVEEFKKKMLEFLEPVIAAWDRLKQALEPLGKTIWEGLQWAWENILLPLGAWVITDALPAFLDILAAAANVLNEVLKALAPVWQEFWDKFLLPLAEWTGSKIIEFLDWLADRLNDLATWIKENPEKFQTFAKILGIVALAIGAIVVIINIVTAVIAIWTTITAIASGVAGLFAAAIAVIASPVFIVIGVILLLIGAIAALIIWWPILSLAAQRAWEAIQNVWSTATNWFGQNVIAPIIEKFNSVFESVKNIFTNIIDFIRSNITEPIKTAFDGALEYVRDRFYSVFEGIRNFIATIVSGITDTINGLISTLADITGQGSGIGTTLDGNGFGGSPQTPAMATGSIAPPAATMANRFAGNTSAATSQPGNNGQQTVVIKFTGSMAELVRNLKPELDRENSRVGGSFTGGVD